jgi:hypothetical protein
VRQVGPCTPYTRNRLRRLNIASGLKARIQSTNLAPEEGLNYAYSDRGFVAFDHYKALLLDAEGKF